MRNQFPKTRHLKNTQAFTTLFRQGRKYKRDPYLQCWTMSQLHSPSRLGIRISKKAVKHATNRNRIKRLVRESFRVGQEKLQGWDILVVARVGVDTLDHHDIRQRLEVIWDILATSQKS